MGRQINHVSLTSPLSPSAQVLMQGHDEGELWGLAVHPSTNKFVTASCDKTIRSWSLDTKVSLYNKYSSTHSMNI